MKMTVLQAFSMVAMPILTLSLEALAPSGAVFTTEHKVTCSDLSLFAAFLCQCDANTIISAGSNGALAAHQAGPGRICWSATVGPLPHAQWQGKTKRYCCLLPQCCYTLCFGWMQCEFSGAQETMLHTGWQHAIDELRCMLQHSAVLHSVKVSQTCSCRSAGARPSHQQLLCSGPCRAA